MKPRFIYVHGNDTVNWTDAIWPVWLERKIKGLGFETVFANMPDSKAAKANIWLPYLQDDLKVGPHDVLIGYSSGATASMRYAESHKILGSILVSPTYTDLNDDLEKQSGYFADKWQWNAVKANQKHLALVWGDDDPYIPQVDFAYMALHLRADKLKIPGGEHFMQRLDMPEIFRYIEQTYRHYLE